jgi:hypothetical protein
VGSPQDGGALLGGAHLLTAAIGRIASTPDEDGALERVDERDHGRAVHPESLGEALLQRWSFRVDERQDREQTAVELEGREGWGLDGLVA